jgi:hypothetical protein
MASTAELVGGFLQIADAAGGKPMRLLEIGASAGLNQAWDQYRYELGEAGQWGPSDSPVRVQADWSVGTSYPASTRNEGSRTLTFTEARAASHSRAVEDAARRRRCLERDTKSGCKSHASPEMAGACLPLVASEAP